MRVGIDGRKIPGSKANGPLAGLDHAKDLGVSGIFFRTVLDMSPTLDPGELRDIRQRADELGLYLESGLGKVNPYAMAEAPELRQIGGGDTLLGFRRMMTACAEIGCLELWAGTANYKPYPGRLAYDRFRTDVSWEDQLVATEQYLRTLAPIARDLGIHINLETHEEITTFELVRLVEAVGPDAIGIVFDTSNPMQRAEHPVRAAERVAPYVRQTHFKDAALAVDADGVLYQERPLGQGLIDFEAILRILAVRTPELTLSIENAQPWDEVAVTYPTFRADQIPSRTQTVVEVFDDAWQAAHPDLSVSELAAYLGLAQDGGRRIAAGDLASIEDCTPTTFGFTDAVDAARSSIKYLHALVDSLGLAT
ncbi:sugar phosphate isomerase/epimerase family protein [Kribbella sp. NPDC059898]|uniref:sugar phosphate isomerase/epimerase family protein n=1 Tax=Kribbella sp. NPDC059898 TaxID=3346995 RepID=UPI003654BA75